MDLHGILDISTCKCKVILQVQVWLKTVFYPIKNHMHVTFAVKNQWNGGMVYSGMG